MIKDKKLIETTLYALQYTIDSEDEYWPCYEEDEYLDIFTLDINDENILWGDSQECYLKDILRMSRHILDNSDPVILNEILQDTDNSLLREYMEARND